jgi:hypothetical protein
MSVNREAMRQAAAKSSMRWVIKGIVAVSASVAVLGVAISAVMLAVS